MRSRVYTFIKVLCLLIITNAHPVIASISSITQLGLSYGDIADPESDTLYVNPAYGYTAGKARLSGNLFYNAFPKSDWLCPNEACKEDLIINQSYLSLQYLQPVNPSFGFYFQIMPVIVSTHLTWKGDEILFKLDAGAGAWFRIMDMISLGVSGKFFSRQVAVTEHYRYLTSARPYTNLFSLRAGITLDLPSNWNIGYSLEFRQTDSPSFLSVSYYSGINFGEFYQGHNAWSLIDDSDFVHHLTVRGRFTDKLSLDNHVRIESSSRVESMDINSVLKIKADFGSLYSGLHYGAGGASMVDIIKISDSSSCFASLYFGADISLITWLNLRLGMNFLNYTYGYNYGIKKHHFLSTNFVPDLGLLFILSDFMRLEINVTELVLTAGPWSYSNHPETTVNFQFSYDFK